MAYTKTTWKDRVVQYPNRYTAVVNGNQYTFTRDNGTVTTTGTPVNASLMNKIETGIYEAHVALDTKAPIASPTFTGTPAVPTPVTTDDSTTIPSTAMVQARSKIAPAIYKTASFTLDSSHAGSHIWCDSGSTITVTIPLNSSVAYPVGTEIFIGRASTGAVTVSPTSGVTLVSSESKRSIYKTYEGASLYKLGTDTWVLYGSLSA